MAIPVPHTKPPYRLTQGALVRLLGEGSRVTIAGIHRIGRVEATALKNGAFIRAACNSFVELVTIAQDAIPILEAILEEREEANGEEDEILRDLLGRVREAIATAEGR